MGKAVGQSVQIGTDWWNQREDGTWVRWNQVTNDWEEVPEGPPQAADSKVLTPGGRVFESPRSLSRVVALLLAACAVVGVISVQSDVAQYSLFNRIERTEITRAEAVEEAEANDSRRAAVGAMYLLLFLATVILFIVWFHRCYRNLLALGVADLRYKTGWAIGGWFVPIMNLFRPKQIADDIWRGTSPTRSPDDLGVGIYPVPGFLLAWWLVWVAALIMNRLVSFSARRTLPTIDSFQSLTRLFIVRNVLFSLAAVLAIVVVLRLMERQERRASALSQQEAG